MGRRGKNSITWGSVRDAGVAAQASLVLTVALIPSLVSQVFVLVGDAVSPLGWILILALLIGGLLAGFYVRAHSRRRKAVGAQAVPSLSEEELAKITTLVSVIGAITEMVTAAPLAISPLQRLLLSLPNLTSLHVVAEVGAPRNGDASESVEALRAWARLRSLPVGITEISSIRPSRFSVDREVVDGLIEHLRGIPKSGAVVDITSDNKPMGVTMFLVAEGAGLPATFLASGTSNKPGAAFMLRALTNPTGLFDEASA